MSLAIDVLSAGGGLAGLGACVKVLLDYIRARRLDPLSERDMPELHRLRREVDKLREQLDQLHGHVARLSSDVADATARAKLHEMSAAKLEAELLRTETALAETTKALDDERRKYHELHVQFVRLTEERDGLAQDLLVMRRQITESTGKHRPLR